MGQAPDEDQPFVMFRAIGVHAMAREMEGYRFPLRDLQVGLIERFAKGAVDVNGTGWILAGVKIGLGHHRAEISFVERAGKIDLPSDKGLKELDLIGSLIGAAVSQFMRSIGSQYNEWRARVVRFHDARQEIPYGCARSGDEGCGLPGRSTEAEGVKAETPLIIMDV